MRHALSVAGPACRTALERYADALRAAGANVTLAAAEAADADWSGLDEDLWVSFDTAGRRGPADDDHDDFEDDEQFSEPENPAAIPFWVEEVYLRTFRLLASELAAAEAWLTHDSLVEAIP